MYFARAYKGLTQEEIRESVEKDGFNPIKISDSPEFIYHKHQHPETKILAFLQGSMDVTFDGKTYHCVSGDKVIIPGNTPHEAIVGKDGCTFFWSEKIVK